MSFYTDDHGRFYLLTFRSTEKFQSQVVGGRFSVDETRLKSFLSEIDKAIVISFISAIALLFASVMLGWDTSSEIQIALMFAAFAPFAHLVISVLRYTSAPAMFSDRVESLERTLARGSLHFHLASFNSSLSIILLFLMISMSSEVFGWDDIVIFAIGLLFWVAYAFVCLINILNLRVSRND